MGCLIPALAPEIPLRTNRGQQPLPPPYLFDTLRISAYFFGFMCMAFAIGFIYM